MIRIILADDHALIRMGIKQLLEDTGEFKIVAEAATGRELIELAKNTSPRPDMAVVDISMPVMNGVDAIRILSVEMPELPCVALSLHDDFNNVFQMIDAGAKAYILKDSEPDQIIATLKEVRDKGHSFNSFVVEKLLEFKQDKKSNEIQQALNNLSEREKEYIKLCCTELNNKEIADQMNVSARTTEGYRESVFEKSGAKTRVGVVLFAIETGLYTPGNWKLK